MVPLYFHVECLSASLSSIVIFPDNACRISPFYKRFKRCTVGVLRYQAIRVRFHSYSNNIVFKAAVSLQCIEECKNDMLSFADLKVFRFYNIATKKTSSYTLGQWIKVSSMVQLISVVELMDDESMRNFYTWRGHCSQTYLRKNGRGYLKAIQKVRNDHTLCKPSYWPEGANSSVVSLFVCNACASRLLYTRHVTNVIGKDAMLYNALLVETMIVMMVYRNAQKVNNDCFEVDFAGEYKLHRFLEFSPVFNEAIGKWQGANRYSSQYDVITPSEIFSMVDQLWDDRSDFIKDDEVFCEYLTRSAVRIFLKSVLTVKDRAKGFAFSSSSDDETAMSAIMATMEKQQAENNSRLKQRNLKKRKIDCDSYIVEVEPPIMINQNLSDILADLSGSLNGSCLNGSRRELAFETTEEARERRAELENYYKYGYCVKHGDVAVHHLSDDDIINPVLIQRFDNRNAGTVTALFNSLDLECAKLLRQQKLYAERKVAYAARTFLTGAVKVNVEKQIAAAKKRVFKTVDFQGKINAARNYTMTEIERVRDALCVQDCHHLDTFIFQFKLANDEIISDMKEMSVYEKNKDSSLTRKEFFGRFPMNSEAGIMIVKFLESSFDAKRKVIAQKLKDIVSDVEQDSKGLCQIWDIINTTDKTGNDRMRECLRSIRENQGAHIQPRVDEHRAFALQRTVDSDVTDASVDFGSSSMRYNDYTCEIPSIHEDLSPLKTMRLPPSRKRKPTTAQRVPGLSVFPNEMTTSRPRRSTPIDASPYKTPSGKKKI